MRIFFFIIFIFFSCKTAKNDLTVIHKLDGSWKYKTGFEASYLEEDPLTWSEVKLPTNLTKTLGIKTGFITLKKEIPESILRLMKQRTPVALNAGRLLDVSKAYFNQILLRERGSVKPYRPGAMRHILKDIPIRNFKGKNYITIILYTEGDFPLQFMDSIKIGPSEAIYNEHMNSEIRSFIFLIIYLVVGLDHLLLSAKRPKDLYNLYFGLFSISISLYWFVANTTTQDILFENSVFLHRKVEHILLFLASPFFSFFIDRFYFHKVSKPIKAFLFVNILLSLLSLFGTMGAIRIYRLIYYISLSMSSLYIIYVTTRQALQKNKDAIYIFPGFLLMALGIFVDIASSMNLFYFPKIGHYTFFMFILSIAFILGNRFARVMNKVEVLNENLETKVKKRTEKLQKTLTEVQTLKNQQDGDYFLTSLLIKPLSGNFLFQQTESPVQIEFIMEQKKKFLFRKRKHEIGGDICISDRINLRKKNYTVFLNADAMGKSIQGAGGSIVIGTVFRSILERTKSSSNFQNISPEIWLKESFKELQNVFVSFQGTMLISAIFGLVDEQSGMLYFINSEYPFSCLYRDEIATFFPDEKVLKKIGIEFLGEGVYINIFQLQENDCVFMGSDGKDDLDIGVDQDGHRIINEDETLFLKLLNESKGKLNELKDLILQRGHLIDDLSIMKLCFNKTTPTSYPESIIEKEEEAKEYANQGSRDKAIALYKEIIKDYPEHSEVLISLFKLYIQKRSYSLSLEVLNIYLSLNDLNTRAIFWSSYLNKRLKKYEKAAEEGERVRLREPENIRNLLNLIDIYQRLGNMEKSKKLLIKLSNYTIKEKNLLDLKKKLELTK